MAEVVDILLRARMEASGITAGVGQIQKALKGLSLPKGLSEDLEKGFSKLNPLLKEYQKQLDKGFSSKKDLQNFNALREKINSTFNELQSKVQKANSQNIRLKVDTQEIDKLDKAIVSKTHELDKALNSVFTKQINVSNITSQFDSMVKTMSRATTIKPMAETAKNLFKTQDYAGYNAQLDKMQNKILSLGKTKMDFAKSLGFKGAENDIAGAEAKIRSFFNSLRVNEGKVNSIERIRKELQGLTQESEKLKLDSLVRGTEALSKASSGLGNLKSGLHSIGDDARQAASGILSAKDQVEQLKTSTQYFFSLRNIFTLLKSGIDDAIQSVKELDKAMTETAVVTDFKVSDMWNMLPEYTKLANKLGATTQGAYETMTLYFQQGLDKQATFEIGEETMKMARIAGLDYAQTTNMMTAALRGFNMELNQTSAKRVNDVYSELAAITASDTRELGLAMERTASIAHSADMDFGNTTAFLAQMIETTREAPENLGTAMKTIIARFQELKENPYGIAEVEGEEVSFNRVDTALKTIGVDLMDNKDKFRDLDDVFMDISAKWDGLSQTQQRYIATIAAGARQQSRFLAMVQNYSRLKELTDAAANSEGASQKQFEKTLDSFESKVNKLKNAWQQFTMSIANNQFVKGGVDGITKILDTTNKLINALSLGSGVVKSFLSLMTAFAGLKIGGRVVNSLVGAMGGLVDPTVGFGAGLKGGFTGNRHAGNAVLASQISNPIVAELRAIYTAVNQEASMVQRNNALNKGQSTEYARYRNFQEARANLRNYSKKGASSTDLITNQLNGLSPKDQKTLEKSFSGTFSGVRQAILNSYTKDIGDSKEINKGLTKASKWLRSSSQLTTEEYYKALRDPAILKQALANADPAGTHGAAAKYLDSLNKQIATEADKLTAQKADQLRFQHQNRQRFDPTYTRTDEQMEKIIGKITSSTAFQEGKKQQAKERVMGASPEYESTKTARAIDAVSNFGAGITSAGMGIQAFGSLLTSSANPALQMFGSALTSIGGLISALGMTISGVTAGFTAVAESAAMAAAADRMKALTGLNVSGGALTAGLMALAAAITGIVVAVKKNRENIEKDAKNLTEKYKKNSDEISSNIATLESYKTDYNRLRRGVDQNGNNINLEDADYQHFLEINDKIAQLNPDIVEGYNAQGHAIIRNNAALEKTLVLEKERQKNLVSDYTDDQSVQTLKKARDLQMQRKRIEHESSFGGTRGRRTSKDEVLDEMEFAPQAAMRTQAQEAGKLWKRGIQEGWASEGLFKDLGIDYNKLVSGDDEAIAAFDRFSTQFSSRLSTAMSAAGSDVDDTTKDSLANIMSEYQDASDQMSELITPMYDQLVAKMGQTDVYKNIPDDMVTYFNQGLKDIVSNANVTDIDGEVNKLSAEFANLTKEGSEYSVILGEIDDAQAAFANNHREEEYGDAAAAAVKQLKKIESGFDKTTGYGQALSEFIENKIAEIQNFTEEGVVTVSEALNTMTDEIAAAEGVLENFKSVADGSNFSTASDNMNEIYKTITEESSDTGLNKHAEGKGDQTYWAGAEALIGRDNLKNRSKKEVDKMLKTIGPMLEEGQKGFDAFANHWYDNVDKLKDANIEGLSFTKEGWFDTIDDNINPEVYEQIASVLGMSEDTLVSMLNKGRQFADIDFANLEQVRTALSTSDSLIVGKGSKDGKANYYIKEDTINAELSNAGITDVNAQEEKKRELAEEQNIHAIEEAGKISKQQLEDMGAVTQKSLIETLGKTGEFSKEEIKAYAERQAELSGKDFDSENFNENYDAWLNELDPQTSALNSIDATTAAIAAAVTRDSIRNGRLDTPKGYESWNALVGGSGRDTKAQHFAAGENEKGEKLSKAEYNEGKQELSDFIASSKDYVGVLKEGLKNATSEEERSKIQQEISDFENKVIPKAQEYLKSGEEQYNTDTTDKQTQIDAVNNGLNQLFSGITPDQINTEQARSTLSQLYGSIINQQPVNLTDDLLTNLEQLKIKPEDIQAALDSGSFTASDKVREKLKKDIQEVEDAAGDGAESADPSKAKAKGKKKGKEAGDKVAEGAGEGVDSSDSSKAKAKGKQKGKEIGDNAAKGTEEGISQGGGHGGKRGLIENGPQKAQQAQESTYTVKTDDKAVDQTAEKVNSLNDIVKGGGTYTINVPGLSNITKAAKAAKALSNSKDTKTISVKTGKADTSSVKAAKKSIGSTEANIKVGAKTKTALSEAEAARKKIDNKKATINVSTKVTGQKVDIYVTKHVKTKNDDGPSTGGYITSAGVLYRARGGKAEHPGYPKKGTDIIPAYLTPGEYVQNRDAVNYFGIDFMRKINHKDLSGALKSFGSAASGRYGRLGPKGKGGLTLTGEKGFEIAWIPSESRSMILGAEGPQMIDLPKDTVVYTHEQSKNILRKKQAIDAGSHYTKGKTYTPPNRLTGSNKNSSKKSANKSDKNKDKNNKATDKNNKNAASVIKKAGKISVWWENQARKVDGAQRKADKLLKNFEKELKLVGRTRYNIKKNNEIIKSGIEATRAAYEKQLKRTLKLNQQSEKKAKSELKSLDKKKTKRTISYEVTKKTKKGKTKKETKKGKVNLAGYISKDTVNDTYVINQKAINKAAKKNKSMAQAIKDLAEKEINDRLSKRNTARDNIVKAQDALEKLSNDIYENFYQWEKDITEIYLLSQKLETITKKLSISGTRAELEFSKLEAGVSTSAQSLPKITKALQDERDLLMQQAAGKAQNVTEAQNEFIESTQFANYIKKYTSGNLKSTEAKNEYVGAKLAFDLLKEVNLEGENFDYSKAIKALDDKKYNKETNDKIKAVLDKIFEKQNNYLESINDAYEVQKEIYEKMEEYQSFISEFEGDLISGIEEQTEDQINRLDKINSSLTKAYKELLDEVKNKLDERRKQEDNAKTESDIAKKQQRLAALRADTAGGHQVEITQLEKEIAEAQQSYQRSLEDQLLDRLQQQGDAAEKQRQRQIDLLEIQKEIAKQTGTNLEQVKKWLEDYQGNYDLIRNAWLANKNYDEATAGERTQLEQEFESEWSKYLAYRAELPGYEKIVGNLEEVPNTTETAVNTLSSIEESVNKIADNIVSLNTNRNVATLRKQGATAKELRQVGYSASNLLAGGYTVDQLINGGFKRDGKKGLKEAGVTTADIKKVKNKISAKTLRAAGYSAAQAHNAGYTNREIKKGGYTAAQFKKYQDYIGNKGAKGVKAAQKAGYTKQQIAKVYGSTQAMTTLNMSGKKTQAITKASLPTLQKIVNRSSKDKAKQTDLAGVKTKIDINGKTKGGSTSGTVNASGRTITANKGSTLYSQKIDTKTGKGKGKVTKITIGKLTTANFKYNKKEATDALVSAIRKQKVGSKINKRMASLVKAAGIAGKTYKLSNGITASIGSNGKIYYNNGTKGVQIWDPATGKLSLQKFDKKKFKEAAKNKNVGREYTQVNNTRKKKKLSHYKTGGLATQTGPAWLDGTPSKPELVLNSQDTKNFLTLKDVLSNALSSTKSVENTYGGDTSYEININVDHLNNDYDVDRVAERVKRIIVKDASYRNVTQVRNFR